AGGGQGDFHACHPFALIVEVADQCSSGFVLNADGRCVCPPGTTFRNGQCRGEPVPIPDPDPRPTDACTLLPGQIRTESGRCICPGGTELRNGRCVRDEPPQCSLLPGQIRTGDGRCVCPSGTRLR